MTLERNVWPKLTEEKMSAITKALDIPKKDEPINSRNSPSALNVLTNSSDFEFSNSMLQLDHDIDQLSLTDKSSSSSTPSPVAHSAPVTPMRGTESVDVSYRDGTQRGFFEGLLGCLRPVWTIIGKAAAAELKQQDDWEIPFENITDLQWLGSGAQGAVFLGKLCGEDVAVKKVRDVKETDIRNLRRLNHPNIISFRGICTQAPCYCIIMEYCPYGQLYEILRDGKEIPPSLILDWAKQISSGMNYLHSHKIIHRDLKSPNVLVAKNDIVRISDFGTSRTWNEKSTKMSFAGTVAWMAPEVIRNEPCSEKVDIWSFGVVLWEILTGVIPYQDVDSSAIIWGVGSNSLHLPVPSTCPDGFKLLMRQCWSAKPRNRPSFRQIIMHLEIASTELLNFKHDDFVQAQNEWRVEVTEELQKIRCEGSHMPQLEEELIKRRREELQHAQDVREHYERKLERANNLYMELTACMLQLEKRERELIKREQALAMCSKKRKSIIRPVIRAQERLERLSKKRAYKSGSEPTSPDGQDKMDSSLTTSSEHILPSPSKVRMRKSRHRRSNSKGSLGNISPIKSPTKDALHDELQSKQIALRHVEMDTNMSPTSFKYLGPKTALRDQIPISDIAHMDHENNEKNMNDVCFGCDGECSDATCSSKRSSRNSADIESNSCDSPLQSPVTDATMDDASDHKVLENQTTTVREKDSNENLNCSLETGTTTQTLDIYQDIEDLDDNAIVNKSIKRSISGSEISPKRTIITQPIENISPLSEPDNAAAQVKLRHPKHSEDSWSEEEGEVSEEDSDARNRRPRSYCSTLSSEGVFSEEENTSEYSTSCKTPDGLLSTNSSENLHLELEKCVLPERYTHHQVKTAQKLRHKAANQPILFETPEVGTSSSSSSDTDECSDITVSTTVHRTRTLDNAGW
ncbi:hypothetical protein ScPMuIL_017319 [Solemya velum]